MRRAEAYTKATEELSGRVDSVFLRLIEALAGIDSVDGAVEACVVAVSDATGASVSAWYVDDERDVVEPGPSAAPGHDGVTDLGSVSRLDAGGDGLVRDAWRKGALLWAAPGSSDGPRFAVPLTHESGTVAVLDCRLDRRQGPRADTVAQIVDAAAPVLGAFADHAAKDEASRRGAARFRSIAESAGDAIIAIGSDGRITYVNAAATRTFGYKRRELEGRTAMRLLSGPMADLDPRRVPALVRRAARHSGGAPVDVLGSRKDGSVVWLALTLTPTDVDPTWAYTAVVRDIGERKTSELGLEDALSRERSAVGRLRRIARMRRTMLHAVAHEIVEPLSVVRGLSVWLLEEAEQGSSHSDEDRRRALSHVSEAADRMSRLLDGFLDLERLDLGTVVPELRRTDIARFVTDIVNENRDLAHATVLDLEHVVVAVDRLHLETILRNLLRNAAAHSPDGAPITVRVGRHRGGVLLSVEDRGPGVPRGERRAIFLPFRRGPAAPGHGLGIGLSLVARFAALDGGRAWVDEAAEGGAAFRVWLPGQRPAAV